MTKYARPYYTEYGTISYEIVDVKNPVTWHDTSILIAKLWYSWPGFDQAKGPAIRQDYHTSRVEWVEKNIGRSMTAEELNLCTNRIYNR